MALLFRHPGAFFSIEEVFHTVAAYLPESISVRQLIAPRGGAGASALLANCSWAGGNRSSINHITGDIHYVVLALPRSRTILSVHDLRILDGPPSLRKSLLKLLWFTLPVKQAGHITVVSEATKVELLRRVRVDSAKVRVIPNPISPQFTRSIRPFNGTRPAILQVGTTDNKNILRLAQALRGIPCTLSILGKPTDEQMTCLRENEVEFRWVAGVSSEEVANLYRECDLVTFISTCEGFGLPIIEGNAVGRAVITSRISSMPEVAGDAALLVDPFDVVSIREALRAVITDGELRKGLIEKGFNNVHRFLPTAIAMQYADLYEEVYRTI